MSNILYIFWDQLSISLLEKYGKSKKIVIIESYYECTYYRHHKKKLVFMLSAMRHFFEEMKDRFDIEYIKTEQSIADELYGYIKQNSIHDLNIIEPGEYRHLKEIKMICFRLKINLNVLQDTRFLCSTAEFNDLMGNKTKLVMENFYRIMRKKTGLLMEKGSPIGGKWNFDSSNRQKLPKNTQKRIISSANIDEITRNVIELVEKKFPDHFGDINPFWLCVTREEALKQLDVFLDEYIDNFGSYQDAMESDNAFVFHSVLSPYLNVGLLDPYEVCLKAEEAYHKNNLRLESVEGFIRQIIGWREFVRGIYWNKMPEYLNLNALNYQNPLPSFYWTGNTKMNCLKNCISQTKKYAYSHHIQRLMVTANFATLFEVTPHQIHEWYMIVYADAHEWVEVPNTIGMGTYADGGIMGTKPYIASANYINSMSDFCNKCEYSYKEKLSENACPFNYLYWNFLIKHQEELKDNLRLKMMYAKIKSMNEDDKLLLQKLSSDFINEIKNSE